MKLRFGLSLLLLAALPGTSTYMLNSFGFGSGGAANSTTSTYALEGISGEVNGQAQSTATYTSNPGFISTQQAHVPVVSTFDNGSGVYYNKLHFVIDTQNNPSDALYAVSISTDNFVSDTRFVKSDNTVGATLTLTDYQTYATWGSSTGTNILGLAPNTTYYLRIKATQGKFTESGYGPTVSVATVNPQLTFSISTSSISMGSLLPNTVIDAPSTINITFATNADNGGDVYINGKNNGLLSATAGATIASATGDLSVLSRGFGARVTATSASSGTLTAQSPYNGSANNVGVTDTTIRKIISGSTATVGGAGSILIKAKASATDAAANNYTDTLTLLASASF